MPFHKMGLHKVLSKVPLVSKILEAPYKRNLKNAVNIADLRLCAKARAHKMVFDYLDAGADVRSERISDAKRSLARSDASMIKGSSL